MSHLAFPHAHTSVEATCAPVAGVGVLACAALGYFYGYWFSHGLA